MSAKYVSDAAEISCRKLADNADNLNVAKISEYGDNIENLRPLMVNHARGPVVEGVFQTLDRAGL